MLTFRKTGSNLKIESQQSHAEHHLVLTDDFKPPPLISKSVISFLNWAPDI